ncbi:MAG: hypothetical protein VYA30_02240 [Myxococcota bacterium]|nr:hypothetical protein [Myxococcota bacterium]
MPLHSSCPPSHQNITNPETSRRARIRCLEAERELTRLVSDSQQFEMLSVAQLKDVEFAATDLSKRGYLAHLWWRLFWNSNERLDGESLLAKVYRKGHPRYAMFKRFSGAEVLLSWLCTAGINPDRVQRSELEFFLVHIYPSHPDFVDSNTVADLVEFSCVCEFLKRTGAVYAEDFSGLFDEGMVTKVLERRADIYALSNGKNRGRWAAMNEGAAAEKTRRKKTAV